MSLPSSPNPEVPTQKPGTNVYTVMLIVSFCAIVTACMILAVELNRFGAYPWWKTPAGAISIQSLL